MNRGTNGSNGMFSKSPPNHSSNSNRIELNENEFYHRFRFGEDDFVNLNVIQNISVNPSQNILMVTTLKSQLYRVELFQQHMEQVHHY
jgi:hypothetical protein